MAAMFRPMPERNTIVDPNNFKYRKHKSNTAGDLIYYKCQKRFDKSFNCQATRSRSYGNSQPSDDGDCKGDKLSQPWFGDTAGVCSVSNFLITLVNIMKED